MGKRISGEELLALATGLPETGVREYDHAVAVTLRDRAIAYVGRDGDAAMVKCLRDEAAALVGSEPEVFSPGHSSGRFGWVRVRLDDVDPEVMRELVVEAWRASATKRLLAELDGESAQNDSWSAGEDQGDRGRGTGSPSRTRSERSE